MATEPPLIFRLINGAIPKNAHHQAFLISDNWDDWGKYSTQFYLRIVDANGLSHDIGNLKLGQIGLEPNSTLGARQQTGHRYPAIPSEFQSLDNSFFSLGQSEDYYEKLAELGDSVRIAVLSSLHDVAYDAALWAEVNDEYVMKESLLRFVTRTAVEGQYRRIAHGGARLTKFSFSYNPPKRLGDGKSPYTLDFNVKPEKMPPTNVHVLIGRNGVGKTHLLSLMTKVLIAPSAEARQSGSFSWNDPEGLTNNFFDTNNASSDESNFANLVVVSYSAFDEKKFPLEDTIPEGKLKYFYVGLHRVGSNLVRL